jgi:hypothetical protein
MVSVWKKKGKTLKFAVSESNNLNEIKGKQLQGRMNGEGR